jgi:hypothetical protein
VVNAEDVAVDTELTHERLMLYARLATNIVDRDTARATGHTNLADAAAYRIDALLDQLFDVRG